MSYVKKYKHHLKQKSVHGERKYLKTDIQPAKMSFKAKTTKIVIILEKKIHVII